MPAAAPPGRSARGPRPPAAPPAGRRPSRRSGRRPVRRLLTVLLVGLLSILVGATTFVTGLLAAPIDFRLPPPPKSALLFAADGKTQFATIRAPEQREPVKAADIPEVMRQAIISAEDERFLDHKGVDPIATVRAAYRDLSGGRLQGGSTLTQQYVKYVYLEDSSRTAERKLREAALALRLERKKSKEEILTDYLNVLYLGNGTYGVQAASKYYYGVGIKDLDLDVKRKRRDPILALARASMLAGVAPAPSAWNPVKDFGTARARQLYTLNRMITNGLVTSDEASSAYGRDVRPKKITPLSRSPTPRSTPTSSPPNCARSSPATARTCCSAAGFG